MVTDTAPRRSRRGHDPGKEGWERTPMDILNPAFTGHFLHAVLSILQGPPLGDPWKWVLRHAHIKDKTAEAQRG